MKRTYVALAVSVLIAGCATAPPPRECLPLPELRAGATPLERRVHTEHIVGLYLKCAGAGA